MGAWASPVLDRLVRGKSKRLGIAQQVVEHGEQELDPEGLHEETVRLVELLPTLPGMLVLVSNEVGLGVVPTAAMARAFVDHAGWLHQRIAEQADVVVFIAAGLPLHLKSPTDR